MFFHPYLFLFCPVLKAKICQKSIRKHRKSNIGMKIVPNWRLWLQKKTGLWELLLCGLAPYLFLPGRKKKKTKTIQIYYEVFIFCSVNMTRNIFTMNNCKISGGKTKQKLKLCGMKLSLKSFLPSSPQVLAKKF